MTVRHIYTPDPDLSEPADVLLEHALLALSYEERFAIAHRIAHNLGYEVRPIQHDRRSRPSK
jgi:hypothetical protein